jgi:hypothetical protein
MASTTKIKNILDELPEVLITTNILSYFYPDEITELQGINKSFKDIISKNGKYIYSKCCHIIPHGKISKVSDFNYDLIDIFWYRDGKLHRDGDLPAVIRANEHCWFDCWNYHLYNDLPAMKLAHFQYKNGKYNLENELTVIIENGKQFWYEHGKLNRDGNLPEEICPDGSQCWYKHGNIHRDGDLPAIIWADGSKCWYQHGKRHRDGNLPAIIWADGVQYWYQRGKIRRNNYWDIAKTIYRHTQLSRYKFKDVLDKLILGLPILGFTGFLYILIK